MLKTRNKLDANEKQARLNELDFQVAQRLSDLEKWLADGLEDFQERQSIRMKELLSTEIAHMTMREFGDKYNGNTVAARASPTKERADPKIDKGAWKRKWMADSEGGDSGSERGAKNPRMTPISPQKKPGFSTTAHKARMATAAVNRTPGTSRIIPRAQASPSPNKARQPFAFGRLVPNPTSRPASPSKAPRPLTTVHKSSSSSQPQLTGRTTRPPSTANFNPTILGKTPTYPGRLPRHDESMVSVNGSPLTNPFQVGLGWFKAGDDDEMMLNDDVVEPLPAALKLTAMGGSGGTLKRSKSQIIVRRDPSYSLHTRTDSGNLPPPSSSTTHSRVASGSDSLPSSSQPPSKPDYGAALAPRPFPSSQSRPHHHRSQSHTLFAIPTSDGHMLEFDPLQTSPRALDALEGITDSAKKQVKEDMVRLVQATVDKWKVA